MREEKIDQPGSLRRLKMWASWPGWQKRDPIVPFCGEANKHEELLTSRWVMRRETEQSRPMTPISR